LGRGKLVPAVSGMGHVMLRGQKKAVQAQKGMLKFDQCTAGAERNKKLVT